MLNMVKDTKLDVNKAAIKNVHARLNQWLFLADDSFKKKNSI